MKVYFQIFEILFFSVVGWLAPANGMDEVNLSGSLDGLRQPISI